MKTKKSSIKVNDTNIETYVAVYFEGNKEEISIELKEIYLYSKEEDSFEYWIKISDIPRDMFLKYISNKETLKSIIDLSKISLYKRSYENYNYLEFVEILEDEETLKRYEILLPNETAVLGYDFYNLLNKEKSQSYKSFALRNRYADNKERETTKNISSVSINFTKKKDTYDSYTTKSIYKEVA